MEKAHSLGQTYACPGLIKPDLGTDIGTYVPRNLSTLEKCKEQTIMDKVRSEGNLR